MKTFSGKIFSPKVLDFTFSHKNVGMISYKIYFFYKNSLLHGHENLRTLIFEVIDFDPEKIKRKGDARFLAFSIYKECRFYKGIFGFFHHLGGKSFSCRHFKLKIFICCKFLSEITL